MSPLPTCMARFHTQVGLRPADTPQAAAAASRRPRLGPGLPQQRPVSGRAERPCPVLPAARARPGGGGSAWGSAARLDQHPNRSLESLTPGFLENFLQLELGSHTRCFHGSHRSSPDMIQGLRGLPSRNSRPPHTNPTPLSTLGASAHAFPPEPFPCADLQVVPSPRKRLKPYSIPGQRRERRHHVRPLIPTTPSALTWHLPGTGG